MLDRRALQQMLGWGIHLFKCPHIHFGSGIHNMRPATQFTISEQEHKRRRLVYLCARGLTRCRYGVAFPLHWFTLIIYAKSVFFTILAIILSSLGGSEGLAITYILLYALYRNIKEITISLLSTGVLSGIGEGGGGGRWWGMFVPSPSFNPTFLFST